MGEKHASAIDEKVEKLAEIERNGNRQNDNTSSKCEKYTPKTNTE